LPKRYARVTFDQVLKIAFNVMDGRPPSFKMCARTSYRAGLQMFHAGDVMRNRAGPKTSAVVTAAGLRGHTMIEA